MKWNNLKSMKCPKCSMEISELLTESGYSCGGREEGSCDFKISKGRFNEVVAGLYKPKYRPEDNQEALNNLGHKEVAEDFSDSPYLE